MLTTACNMSSRRPVIEVLALIHHNVTFSLINTRVLENTKVRIGTESCFVFISSLLFKPEGFFLSPKDHSQQRKGNSCPIFYTHGTTCLVFLVSHKAKNKTLSSASSSMRSDSRSAPCPLETPTLFREESCVCRVNPLPSKEQNPERSWISLFAFLLPLDCDRTSGSLTANGFRLHKRLMPNRLALPLPLQGAKH